MRFTFAFVLIISLLLPGVGSAQDTVGVKGIAAAARIATSRFSDESSLRLFNSLSVMAEGMAAHGQLRVLSIWGPSAGLDCDCLTLNLIVAFNLDGYDLSAFRLGPLLDPVVDSLSTERDRPVVYLTYGMDTARKGLRVEVLKDQLSLTQVPLRRTASPRPNDGW